MSGCVVVGTDGSPESDAALEWALAEARCRDSRLEIVHAWQPPAVTEIPGMVMVEMSEQLEQAARQTLKDTVERVVGPDSGVFTHSWTAAGSPSVVLIDVAQHADLLVVGSRGRGALKSALLGSVALACVAHSPCPVVVIRRAEDRDAAAA
jgi:nucleotide-binding universal stress UspA family protein